MKTFDRFIGIDWSGAKECSSGAIQVAEYHCGDVCPERVDPRPFGKSYWTRSAVLNYIRSLDNRRTLIGFDFAFSVPWLDAIGQLFTSRNNVRSVHSLWERIESLCEGENDLFAGPIWLSDRSPLRPFIYHYHSKHKGHLYCRERFRVTERAVSWRAISVYHLTGAQVGQGSFAGMRLLHTIRKSRGDASIWPFHETENSSVVVVEVYPSFFYRCAKCRRPRKKDTDKEFFGNVRKTLSHFGVNTAHYKFERSIDLADAIVTAAALSHLSRDKNHFSIPSNLDQVATREGWIFGVPFGGAP